MPQSMQFKIVSMTICTLLLSGAVSLGLFLYLSSAAEKETLGMIEEAAYSVQKGIGDQFFERYGDVQAFAANSALRRGALDEIKTVLNDYVVLYGIYDLILVTDVNGKVIAVNTKSAKGEDIKSADLVGADMSSTAWFQNVMAGKTTDDASKNFAGTLFEGPRSHF